jgi:hypothetical protein
MRETQTKELLITMAEKRFPNKKQVIIWVPDDLHYKIKLKAAMNHETMQDMIIRLVTKEIEG